MTDPGITSPAATGGAGRTLAIIAFVIGLVAILMVGGAGPGTRMGLWSFVTGLRTLLKYGAYLGVAAIVLAVIALLISRRGTRGSLVLASLALLLGLAAWYFPWSWRRHAQGVPPIHDITTDFTNPPELTFSRMLRDTSGGKLNAWQYEGDSIAAQQRKAYPDVRPVMLAMNPDEAYRAAMRTARELGWEITVNEPAEHRLEAVDETRWFGFKDDVSIRVLPASGVSRVDIRSVSRVGRSDVGMNAERIRRYTARLREENRGRLAETS
jgi:uncharacterized protein (DUF1499 family)